MSSAACYVNRRRVIAEASLTKVQYPRQIAVQNTLLSTKNCIRDFSLLNYVVIKCCEKLPLRLRCFLDGNGTSEDIIIDSNGYSVIIDGNGECVSAIQFQCILDGNGNSIIVDGNRTGYDNTFDGNGVCAIPPIPPILFGCILDGNGDITLVDGNFTTDNTFDGNGVC